MSSISRSNWFCNQNLGIFQNKLPALIHAMERVDIMTRTIVDRYIVLDKDEDPCFPTCGSFKKIYFCVTGALVLGEFTVHVAARSNLNCPSFLKEKRTFSVLNGVEGTLQPLLIETLGEFEYMITDLFNQGDLLGFINKRKIELGGWSANMLAYSIVSIVLACHAKGVVVRDIKPENFLVRKDNRRCEVIIIDFGMAFLMEEDSKEDSIQSCGTPEYIPNDDWDEMRKTGKFLPTDFSRDAYALGLVLFSLATGSALSEMVTSKKTGRIKGVAFHDRTLFKLGIFEREIEVLVYNQRQHVPPLDKIQKGMRSILLRTYPDVRQVHDLQLINTIPVKIPKWKTEENLHTFLNFASVTRTSSGETIYDLIRSYCERKRIPLGEIDQNRMN